MTGARLENGAAFPDISALDVDGNEHSVADITRDRAAVVLFYRGHW